MAIPKRDPEMEELIRKAVEEQLALNPRFGEPPEPETDEEYAERMREEDAFQHVLQEIAEKYGEEPISRLIEEDRGD